MSQPSSPPDSRVGLHLDRGFFTTRDFCLDLLITPLNKRHNRKGFNCGETTLNQYLQNHTGQDIKRDINRVFIASQVDFTDQVVGYYSLGAGSLDANDLPESLRSRLPRYPVPIAVLGRLAMAKSRQGEGIGSILIADALQRIARASQALAVYAVVVDALNDRAANFYRQFGLMSLPSQPLKLFLPLASFAHLIEP